MAQASPPANQDNADGSKLLGWGGLAAVASALPIVQSPILHPAEGPAGSAAS